MVVRGRPSKIPLWDSWLRRDALKAFGRAFGKPSSLFTATCSKCCVDRLSRQGQSGLEIDRLIRSLLTLSGPTPSRVGWMPHRLAREIS